MNMLISLVEPPKGINTLSVCLSTLIAEILCLCTFTIHCSNLHIEMSCLSSILLPLTRWRHSDDKTQPTDATCAHVRETPRGPLVAARQADAAQRLGGKTAGFV